MGGERSAQQAETRLPAPPRLRPDHALFLDFDGTLVDIAPTPGRVRVAPDLPRMLSDLARQLDGALAVVSGRPLDDLARMLAPFSGAIAGQHGLERRNGGGCAMRRPVPPELDQFRPMLAGFAARHEGVLFEDKGGSLALHYRRMPSLGENCRALIRCLARTSKGKLEALDGKMVVELRSCLVNKGRVIAEFLGEAPFRGRVPVFVGDDITDEDGFVVVDRAGGISVHVGSAATMARYRLASAADVLAWLDRGLSPDDLLVPGFSAPANRVEATAGPPRRRRARLD